MKHDFVVGKTMYTKLKSMSIYEFHRCKNTIYQKKVLINSKARNLVMKARKFIVFKMNKK